MYWLLNFVGGGGFTASARCDVALPAPAMIAALRSMRASALRRRSTNLPPPPWPEHGNGMTVDCRNEAATAARETFTGFIEPSLIFSLQLRNRPIVRVAAI